jgi:hypothetical protein
MQAGRRVTANPVAVIASIPTAMGCDWQLLRIVGGSAKATMLIFGRRHPAFAQQKILKIKRLSAECGTINISPGRCT